MAEERKGNSAEENRPESKFAVFARGTGDVVLAILSALVCTVLYADLVICITKNFEIWLIPLVFMQRPGADFTLFIMTGIILLLLLLLARKLSPISTALYVVVYPLVVVKYAFMAVVRTLLIFVKLFPKLSMLIFVGIILTDIYISVDTTHYGFLKENISYVFVGLILLNLLVLFVFVFSDIFSIFIPSINETLENLKRRFLKDLEKLSKSPSKKTEERIAETYFFLTRIEKTVNKYISVTTLTIVFMLIFTLSFFLNIGLFGLLYRELNLMYPYALASVGLSSIADNIIFSFYVLTGSNVMPINALPTVVKAAMISELILGIVYLTLLFTLFSHVSTEKLKSTRDRIVQAVSETKNTIRNMVAEKIELDDSGELNNLSLGYVMSALIVGSFIKRARSLRK